MPPRPTGGAPLSLRITGLANEVRNCVKPNGVLPATYTCHHIVDYDVGSRVRDRDRNGGSCIVLASDSCGGPRSRWQLMMYPDGGSGQWTVDYSGIRLWWLLTIDYDYNKTA
ncbi:unnamed protein product [Pleuronectes platessa]|uniref:Uncharacterized protein n=1 Tax=Pleuronectes platessa TaxID=8262 RepID=A0A9N7YWF6_PLEPL|nr:unnamed protein product [Pleuronectes platessa]